MDTSSFIIIKLLIYFFIDNHRCGRCDGGNDLKSAPCQEIKGLKGYRIHDDRNLGEDLLVIYVASGGMRLTKKVSLNLLKGVRR